MALVAEGVAPSVLRSGYPLTVRVKTVHGISRHVRSVNLYV